MIGDAVEVGIIAFGWTRLLFSHQGMGAAQVQVGGGARPFPQFLVHFERIWQGRDPIGCACCLRRVARQSLWGIERLNNPQSPPG